ncbi:ABC transporter ATP-binding protein [Lentibacillus salicampi]|uniref:ABC transporter ATP-binding protein n=2 Tax=Lentibacillus salicampi TaxID=175306 RepID=A0A4Y9A9W9_9BACI|nr:ABC transporter ATP-binding protein [Lentibacillus salicampi]
MLDSILLKDNSGQFIIFSIVIIIVFSFSVLLQFLNVIINNRIMNNSNIFLRNEILTKIKKVRVDKIKTYGKGKLVQIIQKDVPVCQSVITSSIFQVIIQSITFLIILSFLSYLNIGLTLLLLVVVPLYFLIYMKFSKKAKYINNNFIVHNDHLINSTQQIYSNHLILKKYKDNAQFFKKYSSSIQSIYEWFDKQGRLKGVVKLFNGGLQGLILLIILIYGGLLVLDNNLSIGAFVAYIMYSINFFSPLDRLMSIMINIKASFVSIQRVVELLSLQDEELVEGKGNKINVGTISLQNFDLEANGNKLLYNLNINFTPGKFNVLLGKNGIGKTTLTYYLSKFYPVPNNNIFIDQTDLNNYSTEYIREQIAILFQKTQFISDSINDHLETKRSNLMLEAVVTRFVQEKRNIFEGKNYVDELSGGEQQLLVFLHALVNYPKVLIVDEGFSSMDKNTKQECIQILRELQSFITVIFITHNDFDYTNSDNVIRLDEKKYMRINQIHNWLL